MLAAGIAWAVLAWTAGMAFHPSLETYAAEVAPGLLVLRRCSDQGETGRLDVPGVKLLGMPVFSRARPFARSSSSRGIMQLSTTTTATRLAACPA